MKKCGICEEEKEEFCEKCSTLDHFEWGKAPQADGSIRLVPVLVDIGAVCMDCCICHLMKQVEVSK